MEQSFAFKQFVAESPMAKLCESQMREGNNLLSACRNVTEQANVLDLHNFALKYNNIPDSWINYTYKAYSVLRHLAFPYVTENIFPPNPKPNQLQVNVRLNNNITAVNVSIETPIMNINFTNIRLNPLAAALLQHNAEDSAADRIGNAMSPLYYQRKFIVASHSSFSTYIFEKTASVHNMICNAYCVLLSITMTLIYVL
jgi:hypothetical protein